MLEAIRVGDHVFYIEYGDHSAKWFRIRQNRPKRDWDSGCAGVIIANRDGWHRTFPQETFAKTHVFKRFSSLFDEYYGPKSHLERFVGTKPSSPHRDLRRTRISS